MSEHINCGTFKDPNEFPADIRAMMDKDRAEAEREWEVEDLRAELTALREIVRRAEEQEKAADLLRDMRETFRFSREDKANAHAEYVEIHRSACRATESAVRAWREKRGEKRDG